MTIAASGALWTHSACGDEVITTTGDRLTGTILEADADVVLLHTTYAGAVEIDRSQVRSLRRGVAATSPLGLTASDTRPVTVADGTQPCAQGGAPAPSDVSAPAPARARARIVSSRSSAFTPGSALSGRVNFALSHDEGNTDKDEIDLDYQLTYRRGWHRFRSLGALEYDTERDEKTTDKWATFNQYSRVFPSGWYGAAWIGLEHDRFSDLRLRTTGGPALGRLVFEGDALNLAVEAGPAALQEDFYDHPDQDFMGAALFLRYDQRVWQDRLQPYHRQFVYAALDGDDKYLWQSWTGLRVPLAGGFTGAVEFEYDYDSAPAVDTETTDTTLRLKLGYEW